MRDTVCYERTTMKYKRRASRGALTIIAVLVCSLVASEASAQWTFDENQCSPRTEHEILALPPPSAMLMVDRSGSMRGSKWSAAKSAIDSVTTDMTQPDPDEIEFGVGLFHGRSASINHEASEDANPDIMSVLNGTGPGGGTPMENAIRTMRNSDTVQGDVPFTPSGTTFASGASGSNEDIPDSCSWRTSSVYIPESGQVDDVRVDITLYERENRRICIPVLGCINFPRLRDDAHDFEIELRHNGRARRISNRRQGGPSVINDREINGFNNVDIQGVWTLAVRDCVQDGDDGVLEGWGLELRSAARQFSGQRATAGILVTDGVPSYSRSGPVQAACDHRQDAPLYVVGLGSGTDREYNDVLAAAGGTGTCSNGDPCDNPNNWAAYDGRCNGSFQTNNANDLNNALSQIANQISCTFPLSVLGGGEVPESTQGCDDYDCVKVVLDNGVGRLRHVDSPSSSIGPRGWKWASQNNRNTVKLSPTYCSQVQQGNVNLVETQVACLCQQDINTTCAVQNPRDCECETGRWACHYGTDVCEPNTASSCPGGLLGENEFCEVGQGVCYDDGQTFCDSSGNLQCDAVEGTPTETPEQTCDALDNDCDGQVDEGLGNGQLCHVDYVNQPGSTAEQSAIEDEIIRCNLGRRYCVNGNDICEPLDPMPEVCNGLDDDCDAQNIVDNLSSSDVPNDSSTLDGRYEPAACFQRDVCRCMGSSDEIEGFTRDGFLKSWANNASGDPDPTCSCGEGLAP